MRGRLLVLRRGSGFSSKGQKDRFVRDGEEN